MACAFLTIILLARIGISYIKKIVYICKYFFQKLKIDFCLPDKKEAGITGL